MNKMDNHNNNSIQQEHEFIKELYELMAKYGIKVIGDHFDHEDIYYFSNNNGIFLSISEFESKE